MKKITFPPLFILLASVLYFFLASVALAQEPTTTPTNEVKLVKYCSSLENGKTTLTNQDGQAVTEPISFNNGASVSLDGVITWKDGSKTSLKSGDCVGIDNWGAVYVSKAPVSTLKENNGIISNK